MWGCWTTCRWAPAGPPAAGCTETRACRPAHAPPCAPWLPLLLQLDCLGDPQLPPGLEGLDGLGLDFGAGSGGAGGDPATSDLLESLQLDASAFSHPASSAGGHGSPSGSGSDSPVVLPRMVPADPAAPQPATSAAAAAAFGLAPAADRTRASPATSESEAPGQAARERSNSPVGGAGAAHAAQAGQRMTAEEEKRLVGGWGRAGLG